MSRRLGYESVILQENLSSIYSYLDVAQTIDPLPLSAFLEIMELEPLFDLSRFVSLDTIKKLYENNEHDNALRTALDADAKGDDRALLYLANLYYENDTPNYILVLQHVPHSHPDFIEINKIIYEYFMCTQKTINTLEERMSNVEHTFRAAVNAQLEQVPYLFDELCGNSGLTPEIKEIKGNVDTLIQVARVQRRMKLEMDNLKFQLQAMAPKEIRVSHAAAALFSTGNIMQEDSNKKAIISAAMPP
ncbi:MAG: hypothetical protein BGO44_00550 [Legionella sp. 39-23]|nr:MAG: hypothetical protein BGO44_00550 [Legionella sp. 39-23]